IPRIAVSGIKAHTKAPFGINTYKERCFCFFLIAVGKPCLPAWPALKEYKAAYLLFGYQPVNFFNMYRIFIRVCCYHKQLPYPFFKRKGIVYAVYPFSFIISMITIENLSLLCRNGLYH